MASQERFYRGVKREVWEARPEMPGKLVYSLKHEVSPLRCPVGPLVAKTYCTTTFTRNKATSANESTRFLCFWLESHQLLHSFTHSFNHSSTRHAWVSSMYQAPTGHISSSTSLRVETGNFKGVGSAVRGGSATRREH